MHLSIVVCTLDRVERVVTCVEALTEQTHPADDFEIIVVDNGSRDGTSARLASQFAGVSNLRLLAEPRKGLSLARNTGWRAARGELVTFMDDDAIAEPGFVAAVVHAFATVTPRPGVLGGRIDPLWEASPPTWLTPRLSVYLSLVDWGPVPRPFPPGCGAVGCNMTVPRDLLVELGGFDERRGRRGKNLQSREDTALHRAISEAGHGAWYEPAAAVKHCIPASRLTRAWMRRRLFWEGVSLGHERALHEASSPGGRALALVRATAGLVVKEPLGWLPFAGDGAAGFEARCMKHYRVGQLAGLLGFVG